MDPSTALIVVDVQLAFEDADHWGRRNNPGCEANQAGEKAKKEGKAAAEKAKNKAEKAKKDVDGQ